MDISGIRFDRHARRRMKWRRITEEEVYFALENPDKVEQSIRGRTNVYKLIGERYIKVTYKEFSDQTLIISAVDKRTGGQNEDRI
jgi:Domain of unknown function (DUF4258)